MLPIKVTNCFLTRPKRGEAAARRALQDHRRLTSSTPELAEDKNAGDVEVRKIPVDLRTSDRKYAIAEAPQKRILVQYSAAGSPNEMINMYEVTPPNTITTTTTGHYDNMEQVTRIHDEEEIVKDLQSSPKDDETYEVQNVNSNSSGYEKLDMNPKENLKENSTKVVKVIKVPIPGGGDLEKELHLDSLLADIAADILEVRRLSRELQEDEQAARYEHQGVDLNSNTTQDSRDPQF